jgi:hypothetical protein
LPVGIPLSSLAPLGLGGLVVQEIVDQPAAFDLFPDLTREFVNEFLWTLHPLWSHGVEIDCWDETVSCVPCGPTER